MKLIFILLMGLCSLLMACKKENKTANIVAMDMVDTAARLKHRAVFMNGPYGSTAGVAKIFEQNSALTLVLDSFIVSNGPDLHVYISKEVNPVQFIDLGVLRANSGTQVYSISGMTDFMENKYAVIHCQQINHLVGSASF